MRLGQVVGFLILAIHLNKYLVYYSEKVSTEYDKPLLSELHTCQEISVFMQKETE